MTIAYSDNVKTAVIDVLSWESKLLAYTLFDVHSGRRAVRARSLDHLGKGYRVDRSSPTSFLDRRTRLRT